MKIITKLKNFALGFLCAFLPLGTFGQNYDILLKGGHVIDAKNDIDGVFDVAITGNRIAAVAVNIPENEGKLIVDASGLYVTPGLIDLHAHMFWGTSEGDYLANSFSALPPDGFTLQYGVTTAVDAGGPGWRNFELYKRQTIDKSTTRIKVFLNIVGSGMSGDPDEQDVGDMDPKLAAMMAFEHPNEIVGIKLAHFKGPNWIPVRKAVEAGRWANIPVMVDFGRSEPSLSIEHLFLEELRPGDIYTHCFADALGRESIVDESGKLKDFVPKAIKRGLIFDVGHGAGSFRWSVAIPALEQGMRPQTISTDLHTGSMNRGMKNQLNVMSKLLNIGMTLEEVILASTWKPAQVIKMDEDLGHLSVGALADVAVLRKLAGKFGFIDVANTRFDGTEKLVCELTILDGKVVWDLNGISMEKWDEAIIPSAPGRSEVLNFINPPK
ncbi:MAG: amidohydrolase/deacetylase family metallohydrolase [Verrucomicrobia bacterium]|nr:amidohydrolase/deacetylase family metallohydrolase [Verrucomicrobiota bacterium]MDA1065042.1 amidohydrolase/deacetylase family metallohydrolase [Verrucomicrobiota bacterium]